MTALRAFLALAFLFLSPPSGHSQLSTQDHLSDPGFWPTKPAVPRSEYVGSQACGPCHSAVYTTQTKTSMALTASRAAFSKVLLSHSTLEFSTGPYRYSIHMDGSVPAFDLESPEKKLHAALVWAFGTGRVGQSYLFAPNNGTFREARVTYFSTLQNLDFTPARAFTSVASPAEAMYRQVSPTEVKLCFGCHTTAAYADGRLDEDKLFLGVTCEACHGPGSKHVSTMQSFALSGVSPSGPLSIFDPRSLAPQDAIDFCGACHSTSWDVILSGKKGVSTARSGPYRLEMSKCWGKGDDRLLCWSCHDPHQQVRSDPESYDHVCLECHASSASAQPATAAAGRASPNSAPFASSSCPVAVSKCVSCHMPKVYVPEMHFNFTDHRIRIARQGYPYPE